MNENTAADTSGTAKIIYILYLVSIVLGITGVVGLVMAYVNRGGADEWLQSHYRFQIRTFWIGLLFSFIGVLLMVTVILAILGWLVFIFILVWLIIRCVKGMQALDQKQPVANPTTWMFG